MEKFGVEEVQDDAKIASTESCPKEGCGQKVEKHGHIRKCPKHGTEPFEKTEDKQ